MIQILYVGIAAVAVGVVAYNVWGTQTANSIATSTSEKIRDASEKIKDASSSIKDASSSSTSKPAQPKPTPYTPSGNAETWSEDDMRKFLSSRSMGVGHHESHEELLAMVMAKLNEPTSTGFDDPTEWSAEDMRQYLRDNKMDAGPHTSRMEMLAMVESKMHEPK